MGRVGSGDARSYRRVCINNGYGGYSVGTVILRRRRLGRTSCREISANMRTPSIVVRNWRDVPPDAVDLTVRWGCTSNAPSRNVLNTAVSIHQVSDKAAFRMHLQQYGNSLVPRTWVQLAEIPDGAYPVVVRPRNHSRGRNLYVCNDAFEVRTACNRHNWDCYIAELIDKVSEYRVFVAQGRAVWVAEKTPGNPDDVAWNVARGGRFDNVRWDNWPLQAVRKAIEAFNLSELDFGGVDVMVDDEGISYVIEINSAPSLTSPYRQESVAKVFDYIVRNGKERIPLSEKHGGYRKFIHPAICERAQLVVGDYYESMY